MHALLHIRLFVCSWLDPDNQAFYGRHMADLVASSGGVLRAIPRDSAHLTYAFLARADDGSLDEIVRVVGGVAARHAPIAIRLGPPSILFARAEARLVYAPIVRGADALAHLGSDIVTELQQRLPDVDISGNRAPHVTLARFRKHTHRGAARTASEALKRSAVASTERTDRIAEIHIVSSELTATAPRYVSLCHVSLV
jgi:2'-5' RNA ligase